MSTANRLLNAMEPADRAAILERTEFVSLPFRLRLEEADVSPKYVYFIETGIASMMYKSRGNYAAEVGLIGLEGCTGGGLILGVDRCPQGINMQVAGSAYRLSRKDFTDTFEERPSLHRLLLRFVHTQLVQRDETALAASKGTILVRLARWLLMVGDRTDDRDVPMTHELMALMLSSRRAGVTVALAELSRLELVTHTRGHVRVLNRSGLVALASPFYGAGSREYDRLIATDVAVGG